MKNASATSFLKVYVTEIRRGRNFLAKRAGSIEIKKLNHNRAYPRRSRSPPNPSHAQRPQEMVYGLKQALREP